MNNIEFDDLDDGDKVTREEMKQEAIKRMEEMHLRKDVIHSFKDGKITMSSKGNIFEVPKDKLEFIDKHEIEIGVMIYHVIHSFANIGETYEFLYVSNYSDDWEYEREMADNKVLYCYSQNVTHPDWSEAGSILVQNVNGSLLRIG